MPKEPTRQTKARLMWRQPPRLSRVGEAQRALMNSMLYLMGDDFEWAILRSDFLVADFGWRSTSALR
jgi:hypothetical protein